jgi:hypothetical protein
VCFDDCNCMSDKNPFMERLDTSCRKDRHNHVMSTARKVKPVSSQWSVTSCKCKLNHFFREKEAKKLHPSIVYYLSERASVTLET